MMTRFPVRVHHLQRIWYAIRGLCAAVPLTIMLTVALAAITAAVNERAVVWTMRVGLAVSMALALAVPLIAVIVAFRAFRETGSPPHPPLASHLPTPTPDDPHDPGAQLLLVRHRATALWVVYRVAPLVGTLLLVIPLFTYYGRGDMTAR